MKVLVVEDDDRLAVALRRGLAECGHVVDIERDGESAEHIAATGIYDAIVLDVVLPEKSGLEVARALRVRGVSTPILMLTSRDTTQDVIDGLNAGADDYLRKPFVFAELEARIRSLARRIAVPVSDELIVADVVLNLATRTVRRGERVLELTARDTALLEYFMRNPGRLLTQRMIEDAVWENDSDNVSNVIAVYVRRLRTRLSEAGGPPLIHTLRGVGYRFGTGDERA